MQFQPADDVPHTFYGDPALIPVDAEAEAPRRSARIKEQQTSASLRDGAVQAAKDDRKKRISETSSSRGASTRKKSSKIQKAELYDVAVAEHYVDSGNDILNLVIPQHNQSTRSNPPVLANLQTLANAAIAFEEDNDVAPEAVVNELKDPEWPIHVEVFDERTEMIRARAEAAAITKREKATGIGEAGTSVSLDEDISWKGHTQKRGKTSSASKDHEKNLGDLHQGVPEIQGAGDSVVSEEERPRVEPENYPENDTKAEEEETSVEKGIDS